MADIEIKISDRRVSGGAFDALRREAASAKGELEGLGRAADIDGELGIDTSSVDDARAELVRLVSVADVDGMVDMDTGEVVRAGRELQDLEADADIDGTLDMDASEVDDVRAELRSIDGESVEVDVDADASSARAEVARLEADVARAGGTVDVDADTAGAESKVRRLRSEIEGIDAEVEVDVTVDDSKLDGLRSKVSGVLDRVDLGEFRVSLQEHVASAFESVNFGDMGKSLGDKMSNAFGAVDWGRFGADAGGTVADGFKDGVGAVSQALPIIGAGLVIAAETWGDDLATGIVSGFNSKQDDIRIALRAGLEPEEMGRVGDVAGRAYSTGLSSGLGDAKEAAALLKAEITGIDSSFNLERGTKQLLAVSQLLGVEVPQVILVAQRSINNGLVGSWDEAMNMMAGAAREFPLFSGELLEQVNEFGPVFSKWGLNGQEQVMLVGRAFETGLVTQIDRASEMFEELNVEGQFLDGRLRPVLDELGISAKGFADQLAAGPETARVALATLLQSLLEVEDGSRRAELTATVFGTAVESSADSTEQLSAMLDVATGSMSDWSGEADRVVEQTEAAQSGFDQLMKMVERTGSALGGAANWGLESLFGQFGQIRRSVDDLAGPLVNLATNMGLIPRPVEDAATVTSVLTDEIMRAAQETDHWTRYGERWAEITEDGGDASATAAGQVAELADGLSDAAREAERMSDALSGWADDSGEAALRGLYEATDELAEGLDDAVAGAYDLAAGWDLTSEAGLRGSQIMGDYRGEIAGVVQAYLDGKISAGEMQAALGDASDGFRAAAEDAGFAGEAIDQLAGDMESLPGELGIEIAAEGDIWEQIDAASLGLEGLQGQTATSIVNAEGNIWELVDAASLGLDTLDQSASMSTADVEGNIWSQIDAASQGLTALDLTEVTSVSNVEGNIWDEIDAASLGLDYLDATTVSSTINADGDSWPLAAEHERQLGIIDRTTVSSTINADGDSWTRAAAIDAQLSSVGARTVWPTINAQGNAWERAEEILGKLNSLNGKSVSTYISTYETTYTGARARISDRRLAHGGVSTAAEGGSRTGMTLVGEQGPELVDLGVGSMVYSSPDTERILSGAGGGGGVTVNVTVHGSVLAERDLRGAIADAIRRGGIDGIGGLR